MGMIMGLLGKKVCSKKISDEKSGCFFVLTLEEVMI